MNLFQLVLKQMRQRALSTWLTLLSVMLGVGLAIAILILYREGSDLFVQKSYGFEVLVGPPKGSPLQLVLNTIYHIDQSPGNVPYSVYEDLLKDRPNVRIAVPYAVGDTYQNYRIIGTLPKLFGTDDELKPLAEERVLEYQPGKRYELAAGSVFHPQKFEAIIGSEIPQRTGLKIGSQFKATHGLSRPEQTPDEHEQQWTVVGVMKPTRTAADRVLFIPLVSFYAIGEHEKALGQQAQLRRQIAPDPPPATHHTHDEPATQKTHAQHDEHDEHGHAFDLRPDGTIDLHLSKDEWQVSAILVKARGPFQASQILYRYKMIDPKASAVNPADVMREFFNTFLKNSTLILLLISLLVIIVAAVGILVAIYNSISARIREIAILRALGATRARILTLICVEAGLIGLIGGVVGAIGGHAVAAIGSLYLNRLLGQSIRWFSFDASEAWCLLGVVAIAFVAGLVPALKAYQTPVATNLVAT